ncbi:MAG TPA: hypothetical protein ENJ90_06815 [Devosia sp.]|nr:hypothetical protein [Devosia sp.]
MSERRAAKFVKALLAGSVAQKEASGLFRIRGQTRGPSLDANAVQLLLSDGVICSTGDVLRASPLARNWLRRKISDSGDPASQHRHVVRQNEGLTVNLNESPLARLASASSKQRAFLQPHHVQAGERVRQIVERARMMERTTMSYDLDRLPGKGHDRFAARDLNDVAIDARNELHKILATLPADCAGVVMDVCGFLKGLQLVERERSWPRRSAKLVLRVGLDQLARHFGYAQVATGSSSNRIHGWLEDGSRPVRFE